MVSINVTGYFHISTFNIYNLRTKGDLTEILSGSEYFYDSLKVTIKCCLNFQASKYDRNLYRRHLKFKDYHLKRNMKYHKMIRFWVHDITVEVRQIHTIILQSSKRKFFHFDVS